MADENAKIITSIHRKELGRRINRDEIFNVEKPTCPRLREGNAENAIVRRLIDFAKTMPRGRNFLGFMPFLNDAGAQAHHVSPRSSTREWCARFFANEDSLTGLKPSYTYISIRRVILNSDKHIFTDITKNMFLNIRNERNIFSFFKYLQIR